MSQIAAIYSYQRPVVSELLCQSVLRPLQTAPHDRCETWRSGPVALAHLALDLSERDQAVIQPAVHPSTGLRVVCDGVFFSRGNLLASLQKTLPASFAAEWSDAELMMHAWLQWGTNGFARLKGEFAAAIWDPRDASLTVVRDKSGFRPVYYTHTNGLFAIASQIKGLRNLPDVDLGMDAEWLGDYLSLSHINREVTAYRGIRRLPAAHWMSVAADGRVRCEQYWRLSEVPIAPARSDVDAIANLRQVTERAVHERMGTSRLPVASMLSGGLDSSLVTAMTCLKARETARPVVAVSSVLPPSYAGLETDEREFIEALLDQYPDIDWLGIHSGHTNMFSNLEKLLSDFDQPIRDINYCVMKIALESAANNGARIVLTGMGGDWHISAHLQSAVAAKLLRLRWREVAAHGRQICATRPHFTMLRFLRGTVASQLLGFGKLRGVLEHLGALHRIGTFEPQFSAAIQRRYRLKGRHDELRRQQWHNPYQPLGWSDACIFESGMTAHVLELLAGYGINTGTLVTTPLLDEDVVAASAALPVSLRSQITLSRYPIRAIAEGIVPDKIRLRQCKAAFWPDWQSKSTKAEAGGDASDEVLVARFLKALLTLHDHGIVL